MSISYPLALPTATGIRSIEWLKDTSIRYTESPFDLTKKVYANAGKRWKAQVALPAMTITNGRIWEAFFLSLNGMEGTFWLGPTLDKTARGVATGTPLVNGASQSGQSLVSDGWTVSQTGILKAGDWLQVGNYLYKVLQDVDSDVGGNATIDIWPSLAKAVPSDNDAITVANPKGLFRILEMPSMNLSENHIVEGTAFTAVEAI